MLPEIQSAPTGNMQYPIEVSHLYKSFKVYKDKAHTLKDRVLFRKRNAYTVNHVLQDVSFRCQKGEALGLIGHNGCGKSTTLKLLNRILYPDSGTIRMRGRISSLIELGAGFHPDMTGRENIYINASIFGLKWKEVDERLADIIRFSELEQFIDNPVRTYSSGMYMRLAFSIAINVDADILLVDEILAVGDANFQQKCFAKLQALKEQGCTIVIVSHSMDQIRSICDQVIWLDEGRIVRMGDADTVTQEYLLTMEQQKHRRELKEAGLDPDSDPMLRYPVQQVSAQVNHYANRRGNMRVRFANITICNARGEPCLSFQHGDKLVVRFSMEGAVPKEEISEGTTTKGVIAQEALPGRAVTKGVVPGKAATKGAPRTGLHVIFNFFNYFGVLCSTFDSAENAKAAGGGSSAENAEAAGGGSSAGNAKAAGGGSSAGCMRPRKAIINADSLAAACNVVPEEDSKEADNTGGWQQQNAASGCFVIDDLSFAEGTYILDAIIRDFDDEDHDCDCLGHLIEFHVTCDPSQGTGIVAMKNHWEP